MSAPNNNSAMSADATPFVPGRNLNAAPFVPGGGGAAVAAVNLSAAAAPFTPGGARPATQTQPQVPATGGIGFGGNNATNFGQQQRGPPPPIQQNQQQVPQYNSNNNNQQQLPPPGFLPPPPQQQQQNQQQYYNNNNNQQFLPPPPPPPPQGQFFNNNNQQQQNPRYNINNNNNNYNQNQQQQYNNNNSNGGQQRRPQPNNNNNNNNQTSNNQPAPAFVPQYPLPENAVRSILPSNHRPLVFLFLGPRGSGKSTQAQLLAKRLGLSYFSSGAAVTEEKREPFSALADAIDDAISKASSTASSSATLRGIVLDRCIANGTIDCLFLLYLLHNSKYNLQLDMTIFLNGDYLAAQERAESRDKDNDKKNHVAFSKRMQEHSAVFDATENILQSYGGLTNIQVKSGQSIEDVHKIVAEHVDKYIVELKSSQIGLLRTRVFPRLKLPKLGAGVLMDGDVHTWIDMRDKIQKTVGTPAHKFAQFPGANVGAVLDQHNLNELVVPYKNKYNVTYKADGIRVLVVRTHSQGTFLVTAKFMCRFVFEEVEKFVQQSKNAGNNNNNNTPSPLPKWFPKALLPTSLAEKNTIKLEDKEIDVPNPFKDFKENDVSHIIDAELVVFENNPELTKEQQSKLPPWRIYGFDCLVNNGTRQHDSSFPVRYQIMVEFLKAVYDFDGNQIPDSEKRIVVKPFVVATTLPQLLSTQPEFPIDGLLFQQPGKYMVPRDTRSLKWKLPTQCTVDFRLSNGYFDEARNVWMFIPCSIGFRAAAVSTTTSTNNNSGNDNGAAAAAVRDEIPFEKAIVEIPNDKIANFCDGSIAECVQVREQPKFAAGVAKFKAPLAVNKKADPLSELVAAHPLSQASGPLAPPVTRKVPGFYLEFWRTRGGGLHSSNLEFVQQDGVTLWEVVRDRTVDKPTPNLEEVATATAHMKHVPLEDLVNAVAGRR